MASDFSKVRGTPMTENGDRGASTANASYLARFGLEEADLSPEMRACLRELLRETAELHRALEDTRSRIAELEALADIDPLVPVLNRRAFLRELARVMSFAERYNTPASLLYFDLDNLKAINDRYGHDAGDAALRQVAQLLTAHVRVSDAVGRLGGDEFGVILARADRDHALQKGRSLKEIIATTPLCWTHDTLTIAASCGVHELNGGEDPDGAIASADRAMYEQKNARRNDRPPPSVRR